MCENIDAIEITHKMASTEIDGTFYAKLMEDTDINPVYDPVNKTTTFEFKFPEWLSQNYEKEVVRDIINTITPIMAEECGKYIKQSD